MSFTKLVRFALNGQAHFGELLSSDESGYTVERLTGDLWGTLESTGETHITDTLLCPLPSTPLILCVGLNYRQHAEEAKLPVPKYPVIFTKPADALTGPFDDVLVHPDVQQKLDFEGELCVVIGKDAKNVSETDALDFVCGNCVGNDVSARSFQMPDASGGQFCYAKSFDGFAPIGPAIWSKNLVPDPQRLRYKTIVDGVVEQETGTNDMIWTVRQIIAHLSKGTTLRRGSVIMTGTPSGVGFFKNKFLQNSQIVAVEVEGLGGIANRMVFEPLRSSI